MSSEKIKISEVKHFVDEKGRQVMQHALIGKDRGAVKEYHGVAFVQTPNGPFNFEFEFPSGITLIKAFDMFDKTVEKELEKMKKEHEEQQKKAQSEIVAAKKSNIVGLDGRPA